MATRHETRDANLTHVDLRRRASRAAPRIESLLLGPPNATLRRLLTDQGVKHWKGYAFLFAMMGLIALTTSLSAWIIGKIVDKIFVGHTLEEFLRKRRARPTSASVSSRTSPIMESLGGFAIAATATP